MDQEVCYHTFLEHKDKVLALSAYKNLLVSGSKDKLVKVFDLSALAVKFTLIGIIIIWGHEAKVNCVDFSKFGDFIASGSEDYSIRIWSV